MTLPLFLADLADPAVGAVLRLAGDEGRHAAVVRRIRVGEEILLADGRGRGVRCLTTGSDKQGLDLEVLEVVETPAPPVRIVAVQGLAKGDRSELAVEMMTEVGVDEIRPWQAARSIVKWQGDRGEKSRAKWQSTAREAAKQSRRFRIPLVGDTLSTRALVDLLGAADLALVLHEDGTESLAAIELPASGTVALVVGPEGGIGPEELALLVEAGARVVTLGDGVLRTSTAGVVAVGHLRLRS
ncbi:16S rRNA (uracil(1498)-N(3))-methyltransferase [Granulicoccus sp. GXG6511]|uniref:16S rRNA (uracil(1498)-N(3))-methyltransferase n=1 Tax=Granulicoccus sp. GXG6511 TaxID=3381351 RepID=UPI003D7E3D1B